MNRTTKYWFTFNYRNPSRQNPEPLQQQSGAHTHNWIGGSWTATICHNRQEVRLTRCLGFPNGNPRLESLKWMRGKCKSPWWRCRSRLLLQSSKDQRVWVEGLRDLWVLSLQQWWVKVFWSSYLRLKKGRGIYTPPKTSRCNLQGRRNIQPELGPEYSGREPKCPA